MSAPVPESRAAVFLHAACKRRALYLSAFAILRFQAFGKIVPRQNSIRTTLIVFSMILASMLRLLVLLFAVVVRSLRDLLLENLALRQQLCVLA